MSSNLVPRNHLPGNFCVDEDVPLSNHSILKRVCSCEIIGDVTCVDTYLLSHRLSKCIQLIIEKHDNIDFDTYWIPYIKHPFFILLPNTVLKSL